MLNGRQTRLSLDKKIISSDFGHIRTMVGNVYAQLPVMFANC